mgnify:FL=1|tara:strand:- start:7622 stop:8041 length:420 start_codon:yes stop_codon:yes gene_type:complete
MMWKLIGVFLGFVGVAILVMYLSSPSGIDAASDGKALTEVNVPVLSNAEKAGEVAYNKNCASCHGINAAGKEGLAPPLVHRIYEPNHHGDMSFVLAAKQGTRQHHWRYGNMPPVRGVSDGEIANIIAHVRRLQSANGIN